MANLLTNPGFEVANGGEWWGSHAGCTVTRVSSQAHGGTYSGQIDLNGSTATMRVINSINNSGGAGDVFNGRVWVKCTNATTSLRFRVLSMYQGIYKDWSTSAYTTNDGVWRMYEKSFTTTQLYDVIRFEIGLDGTSEVVTYYIDDSDLRKNESLPPSITLDTVLPDADIVTTGWSTAPLFSKINDASDATVISATAS